MTPTLGPAAQSPLTAPPRGPERGSPAERPAGGAGGRPRLTTARRDGRGRPRRRRWDVSQDGGAPGHGAGGPQPGAAAHRPAAAHPQLPRLPRPDEVRVQGGEGGGLGEAREAFPGPRGE